MDGAVADALVRERLGECAEVQDPITTASRLALVGETVEVLVDGTDDDGALVGRTHREAPEIDGVVRLVGDPLDAALFARPGRDRDRDRVAASPAPTSRRRPIESTRGSSGDAS